ncbi:MAG: glycosyltransferase [Mycobacteriales bacterium]
MAHRLEPVADVTEEAAAAVPPGGMPATRRLRVLMAVSAAEGVGGLETSFGRIVPALREQGVDASVLVIDAAGAGPASAVFFGQLMPTYTARTVRQAARIVRRYDVVHVHGAAGTVLWPLAAVVACALTRTRLVATLHLPGVPDLPPRRRGRLRAKAERLPRELLLAWAADVVASPTEAAAVVARHRLAPLRVPVRALDNGVPDPGPAALPGGPLRLVFVGRLSEQKRPDVFVDAVERAVSDGADIEADLVGDGPLCVNVAARIGASAARDRITMHGFVPDPGAILAAGHALVQTSGAEGGPMVAMEAAAIGRGIIARDGVPGLGAEWGDGVLRVSMDPADLAGGFARAFAVLAADRSAVERLGAGARARYATHHTDAHAARRLAAAYTDAIRRGGRRRAQGSRA